MQEKTQYVHVNQYTRPGIKNHGVKGIVWHYTADPGATAQNERDYFDGTCVRSERYASAHDVIDTKQVVHMIPHNEVAYHAHDNNRCLVSQLADNANFTAIGVELCIDKAGKLEDVTYQNAVAYGVELAKQYKLDPLKDFFRHYDVTRKNCPAFWVSDPAGFEKFKKDVTEKLNGHVDAYVRPVAGGNVRVTKDDDLLKKGDKGPAVKALQQKLIKTGYKLPKYGADSDFGEETDHAVREFQQDHDLAVDGIAGPMTMAKLDDVIAEKEKPKSKPKNSGIPVVGHIKIVNVSNAAYICDRPSSSKSKNLATAKKGSVLPISGSVSGWFEVIYKGRRAYVNEKYGKRV